MKRKDVFLLVAALLAAGGLWLARAPRRAQPKESEQTHKSADHNPTSQRFTMDVGVETPPVEPKAGQMLDRPARLAPPIPNRRFTDFTPEQRVEFARKGHGPGG